MTTHVGKLIEEFGADNELTLREVSSPANKKLFTVDELLPQLDNYKTEEFHTMTVKLLSVMKWARPDLETTVFSCEKSIKQ
eukprot:2165991-Ditylum_brightwellii.AAC.1